MFDNSRGIRRYQNLKQFFTQMIALLPLNQTETCNGVATIIKSHTITFHLNNFVNRMQIRNFSGNE